MLQGQLAGTNHVQQAFKDVKTKNNYQKPNQYSHRDMKLGHVAEIKWKLYTLGNINQGRVASLSLIYLWNYVCLVLSPLSL